MPPSINPTRRQFIQTASLAALAAGFPSLRAAPEGATPPRYRHLVSPDRKLRIASIGVSGKGYSDIMGSAGEDIVALCDVDFARGRNTFQTFPRAARYRDYRQMLRELGDQIDAVTISTPDHTHFPAAMLALELGKHVYVQKPLTHTIGEVRQLKEAARQAGVVTQMGNQGHANEGTRLVREWIEAGVIGPVREIHAWTNRPIWPQGITLPAPAPVPETMDWDLWLGTAPERPYSPKIAPFNWRGLWDYGCGALGDMGCHMLDAPFWALDLRGDVRLSAISDGTTAVACPTGATVTYEFPERNGRPALKLVWYEGQHRPPVPPEWEADRKFPIGAVLYIGDEGKIIAEGDYSESPRLFPDSKMAEFKNRPPRKYPRVPKANPHLEWIKACKGGPAPGSDIVDHSADLTEMVLLGNLAIRTGKPVQWDASRGVCVGLPEADRLIHKNYRLF